MIKCFSSVRVQDLKKENVRLMKAFCLIVLSLILLKNIIWAFETMTSNIIFLCFLYVIPWITMYVLRIFKAFSFKCNLFPVPCYLPNLLFLWNLFALLYSSSSMKPLLLSQNQLALKLEVVKFLWHIYTKARNHSQSWTGSHI